MENTQQKQGSGSPGRLASVLVWLRSSAPALLAGAALAVTASELVDPGRVGKLTAVVLGALYGLVLRVLVRVFPGRPGARPLAGLVLGALPFALFAAGRLPPDERIGLGLGLALLGLLIGLLERDQ